MSDLPPTPPGIKPPNSAVAILVDELGIESTRELVQIYLREFDRLNHELNSGDRQRQHFAAHSLKSSAHHMGAIGLAELMGELEDRLSNPEGTPLTETDFDNVITEFAATSGVLRTFAAG